MTGVVIGWIGTVGGLVSTVALWGAICVMLYQNRPPGGVAARMIFALVVTMAYAFSVGRLSVIGL